METNQLGQIQNMTLNITQPVKMDHEMDFCELVLMCGKNGVGKTIILKYSWVLASIAHIIVQLRAISGEVLIETAQFYLDYSFDDHNTDGTIGCGFASGMEVEIVCQEGKVIGVNSTKDPSITISNPPTYMSGETRLISETVKYLRLCKANDIAFKVACNESNLLKVLALYKLYDVLFMEGILTRIKKGFSEEEIVDLGLRIQKFDVADGLVFKGLKISDDEEDILMSSDGENWKSVRTLGAGHQALLTIVLGGLQ